MGALVPFGILLLAKLLIAIPTNSNNSPLDEYGKKISRMTVLQGTTNEPFTSNQVESVGFSTQSLDGHMNFQMYYMPQEIKQLETAQPASESKTQFYRHQEFKPQVKIIPEHQQSKENKQFIDVFNEPTYQKIPLVYYDTNSKSVQNYHKPEEHQVMLMYVPQHQQNFKEQNDNMARTIMSEILPAMEEFKQFKQEFFNEEKPTQSNIYEYFPKDINTISPPPSERKYANYEKFQAEDALTHNQHYLPSYESVSKSKEDHYIKPKKKQIHYHQHKHMHDHDHHQKHKHKHADEHKHQHKHKHHEKNLHKHQHEDHHSHWHDSKEDHEHWNNHDHKHRGEHKHKHEQEHLHHQESHHKHSHMEDQDHKHDHHHNHDHKHRGHHGHDHHHGHEHDESHKHGHKHNHKHSKHDS